jgi:hypothetical protein
MIGLSGARVLLLDDEPNEVLPLMKAFARAGVPVAYFDGKKNGLPAKSMKLRGVRLAILDMNLGVTGSDETIASTLVQTLSSIISEDNGPYGALIWTNHPDLTDIVGRYIHAHRTLPNPVFVLQLKKAEFLSGLGSNARMRVSLSSLSSRILAALNASSPLECMQAWEGNAFTAATNVTNSIVEIEGTGIADLAGWKQAWCEQAAKLLLVVSQAQSGQHHNAATVLDSAFLALNPLHSDRMDALVEASAKKLAHHAAKVAAATGASSITRRSKVNTMLHLAADHLTAFQPGNMYVFSGTERPSFIPNLTSLMGDCIHGRDAQHAENLAFLLERSRICAVEISPVCDHAQAKIGFARFITGFIVPAEDGDVERRLNRKAQYLKPIGPFNLESPNGPVNSYIYLNSRFIASSTLKEASKLKAVCRVRSELLADLQFWASYQGARQGIMMLSI